MIRPIIECLFQLSQEMDLLEDDAKTYKMVGPVLMSIDLKEAKDNVNSRIKYITEEMYAIWSFVLSDLIG